MQLKLWDVSKIDIGEGVLEKTRWAGAIDNVGGKVLSALVRATKALGECSECRGSRWGQHLSCHPCLLLFEV